MVDKHVVSSAQQAAVAEVGESTVLPRFEVVGVAPFGFAVTAGEHTAAVADDQRPDLTFGELALAPTEVQHVTGAGIAQDPAHDPTAHQHRSGHEPGVGAVGAVAAAQDPVGFAVAERAQHLGQRITVEERLGLLEEGLGDELSGDVGVDDDVHPTRRTGVLAQLVDEHPAEDVDDQVVVPLLTRPGPFRRIDGIGPVQGLESAVDDRQVFGGGVELGPPQLAGHPGAERSFGLVGGGPVIDGFGPLAQHLGEVRQRQLGTQLDQAFDTGRKHLLAVP